MSSTSWWTRLAYTPLSDAVRGDLTASLDWQAKLHNSGVPPSAQRQIVSVVRKTRLWRREQADVAQELSAHFLDGLSQGQTAERLVADFGDPARVARLIRRAKKRNRPWHWQLGRRGIQLLGVLALLYVVVIAITISRHPSPKVDYLAKANAKTLAVSEAESAWPLYRELWAQYDERNMDSRDLWAPGHPEWESTIELLRVNAHWLEQLRQAATKPAFGLPAGFAWDYDAEDARVLFGEGWTPRTRPAEDDPRRLHDENLAGVLLPHLAKLKVMAMWLAADLAWAGEQGDGARVVANYQAILGTARHNREQVFLINQLVAIANITIGNRAVAGVLQRNPETLSDSNLVELAHALATSVEHLAVDFRGERMMFQDIVQRIYSDNGEGDGYLTLEGIRLLRDLGLVPEDLEQARLIPYLDQSELGARAISAAMAPVVAELFASRRELMAEHNRLMTLMEAEALQPLWLQLRDASEATREIEAMRESSRLRLKYAPISLLLPALGGAARKSAESEAFSRALMVAVALEAYHREHGTYPERLDSLAPRWLPEVPPDPSTGQPLLYRVEDGQPIIYGRGWDATDDRGQVTENAIKFWPRLSPDRSDSGDWVFYPPPNRELAGD